MNYAQSASDTESVGAHVAKVSNFLSKQFNFKILECFL